MQVSAGLCRAIPESTNLTSTASTTSVDKSVCLYHLAARHKCKYRGPCVLVCIHRDWLWWETTPDRHGILV